jgi:hypothetical protein
MFNADFYPTPPNVIEQMCMGVTIDGSIVLEPSGGAGHIVDYLKASGAKQVISCEKHNDLRSILMRKCKVISDDFLTVQSSDISHINLIIGNPPFSRGDEHILHAYKIAPAGCTIVMLCNLETYNNSYSATRKELRTIIDTYGSCTNIGEAFTTAERTTYTKVGLIRIHKQGESKAEFEGFFMEDEPAEVQGNGIMPYNFVRDLVNRYVSAVQLYDKQLQIGAEMNELTSSFFTSKLSFTCQKDSLPVMRNDFKKDLQKSAWQWVFTKMNMQKYSTTGLKSDINKFVEQQSEVPFSMRNIYKMIEIVIGTTGNRMDRAIIEVFDKLTEHYSENRYNVEGWKTNSHYLVNEKFIMPYGVNRGWSGEIEFRWGSKGTELMDDLQKALCFITGTNYDDMYSLHSAGSQRYKIEVDGKILMDNRHSHLPYLESIDIAQPYADRLISEGKKNVKVIPPMQWGEWTKWGFFEIKCYKKGTVHCKFIDTDLWATFNQHVARIKGYPLPEGMKNKKK